MRGCGATLRRLSKVSRASAYRPSSNSASPRRKRQAGFCGSLARCFSAHWRAASACQRSSNTSPSLATSVSGSSCWRVPQVRAGHSRQTHNATMARGYPMKRVRTSLADNIAIILLNEFLEPFWVALLQGFHNVLTKHAWDFIRFLIGQLKVAHTGACCPCLLLIDVGLRHKLGHRKPTSLAQHRHRHPHHLTALRHVLHGLLQAILRVPQALQCLLLWWQSLLAPLPIQGALRLTH